MSNDTPSITEPEDPWIGVVWADVFKQSVGVYDSPEARIQGLLHNRVEKPEPLALTGYWAAVTYDFNVDGAMILSLVLTPEAIRRPSTWVHEAVHIVDVIFDHLGINPTVDNTETRAYFTQSVFEQIEDIVAEYKRKRRTRKARKPRKSAKAQNTPTSPSLH